MELKKLWLADQVTKLLRYEPMSSEILMVAEERIKYLQSNQVLDDPIIDEKLQQQLNRIDALRDEWIDKRPQNATQKTKLEEYFHIDYTYESNRIEGNTLSLQETHLVINEGMTIGGHSIVEHLEAINHQGAIGFIDELMTEHAKLNRRTVMELHRLVLKGIDDDNAGRIRKIPVRISGSKHEPPQPYLLDKMMEDYFAHYKMQSARMHPVLLAAEMHERLVTIHPFVDGNGRTSRLIMNLVLLQNGYTIAILKGDDRSRLSYYRALESVQVDGRTLPFHQLVADAVEASLKAHLALC